MWMRVALMHRGRAKVNVAFLPRKVAPARNSRSYTPLSGWPQKMQNDSSTGANTDALIERVLKTTICSAIPRFQTSCIYPEE
jgi:hypothetical protein